MRFSHIMPAAFLAAGLFSTSAFAADPETIVIPTEMDYSRAAETVDPVISNLKASKFQDAVDLAFKDSPFVGDMKTQISVLVGQINTAADVYGPIKQCELAERSHLGSFLIRLTYVCQHDDYLTLWNFKVAKTAKSLSIMSMDFENAT